MTGQAIHVSASADVDGDGSEGSPFTSIQDAIDAARPGDVIMVGAGTYHENLKITKNGTEDAPLLIRAADGPGTVTVKSVDPAKDTINIAGAENITVPGLDLHGLDDSAKQVVHIHARNDNSDQPHDVLISDNTIEGTQSIAVMVKG